MRRDWNKNVGQPVERIMERNVTDQNTTVTDLDIKLEDFPEETSQDTPVATGTPQLDGQEDSIVSSGDPAMDASFMSESIYEKLPSPSPKSLRHRSNRMQPCGLGCESQLTTDTRETIDANPT